MPINILPNRNLDSGLFELSGGSRNTANLVGVGMPWQRSAFYYTPAKLIPEITHPKPDVESGVMDRYRTVPSGLVMRYPVKVKGGSRPFNYAVTDAPSGVTIDQQGVVEWDNPLIGSYSFTVRVRTQDYGRQIGGRSDADWGEKFVTYTCNVIDREDSTKFVFGSGTGNDANNGAYSTPIATLNEVFGSTNYAGKQLHLLSGTFETNGLAQYRPGDNTPYIIWGVDGHTVNINLTERNFAPQTDGFLVGEVNITDAGHGATVNNQRIFIPENVNRGGLFAVTVTNPSNGILGNDNATTLYTYGGAGTARDDWFVSHCIETGRPAAANSAGLYVVYRVNRFVDEYNLVTGSGSYNCYRKDSVTNSTSAFSKVLTGGSGYAFSTGCQSQAYTTHSIEACYCTTDAEVRLNLGAFNVYGDHYYYRMSIKNDLRMLQTDAVGQGPFYLEGNAIEGVIVSGQPLDNVISTDNEVTASSGVFDVNLNLINPYRDSWLGRRGAEL